MLRVCFFEHRLKHALGNAKCRLLCRGKRPAWLERADGTFDSLGTGKGRVASSVNTRQGSCHDNESSHRFHDCFQAEPSFSVSEINRIAETTKLLSRLVEILVMGHLSYTKCSCS